jgi:osmotically inducible lipoprotein OsmB
MVFTLSREKQDGSLCACNIRNRPAPHGYEIERHFQRGACQGHNRFSQIANKFLAFLIRGRLVIGNIRYAPCVVFFQIIIGSRSAIRRSTQESGIGSSRKGAKMKGKKGLIILSAILVIAASSGCSTPLSTREKGAGIGALGGATAGGLIGAAVGHPAAGAAIGGALGLGTGALVGDQLQGQEQTQYRQQQQIDQNQAEIQRQRQQIDQLKRRQEY